MNLSLCRALLTVPLLCAAACTRTGSAQATSAPAATTAPVAQEQQPSSDVPVDTQKPSSLIAPAVDHLGQVVSQVQLERWKGSSRDETDSNLRSVERNVSTTLPGLVTTADAQPTSVAASLPLLRNLDALCAVMIRVSVAARGNAPAPQAESLNGALTALQSARNTLADQVQTLAAAQEKQLAAQDHAIASLREQVISKQAIATAPAPPTTKPRPKTPRPRKNPATPAPATTSKPAQQ